MEWGVTENEAWFFRRGLWYYLGALIIGGVLVVFSFPYAVRLYGKFKARSLARGAAASCKQGDYKSALLQARKALDIDRNDLPATRALARSLDAVGAPVAIQWHRRLEELQPGDMENLIAWARCALQAGDPITAEMALKKVKPADQDNAVWHEVAAGIALAKRDGDAAISHLVEAARLNPADNSYHLNLARLRLTSTNPLVRDEGRKTLEDLSASSETNLSALRLLIEDATTRGETARVRELGKSLEANPGAKLADRLTLLSAQRTVDDPDFFTHLDQLQASAVHNPTDLADLIGWMNDHNLAIAVSEWATNLPPELISRPPVSLALADAYSRSSDWNRLKDSLDASAPDRLDFFRLALHSRELREHGDENGARDEWKRALDAAKTRQPWLEGLARLAMARGWQQEADDCLGALADLPACPRWALDALWSSAMKTDDTSRIYRISRLLLLNAPNDLAVRGNFVYLSLLTRDTQENPDARAEALYKENPGNAAIVRIYGLSLYQQGKKDEALKVMARLPTEELQRPVAALYYGIFLAATGQSDKARDYLQRARELPMLREEKTLLAGAQETLRVAAKSEQTNAAFGGF